MNTLSGKSHGRMRKAYCLSSAVHHLDSASLHLDGGRSPYMNRNLLSVECKHSKPSVFYSCTAHFSTIIVPNGKKQARKCPFYRLLRAFENYSNSTTTNQFCLEIIICRVCRSFDYLIYPYYPAYTG